MNQMRLPWAEQSELGKSNQVGLDLETSEVVIGLMAQALIAVVRAAQESTDER